MKLTELSVKRPLLILVIFTVLIIFGVISYQRLNYNLLPKFDANVVTIATVYRGASAEEIENNVTKKIEDGISTIEGIKSVISYSQENVSTVTVELNDGVDVDKALADAQRKIEQIGTELPDDIENPIINKFSTDETPVLRINLTADMDGKVLYDLLDKQIKPQLSNVKGVGQINVIGGLERQIRVKIDKQKAEAYNLSTTQIATLINYAGLSTPAGNVKNENFQYSIKFDSKFQDIETIKNLPLVRMPDGGTIYVKDLADVYDGTIELEKLNRYNGIPAVGLQIIKQSDANAVEVSKLSKIKMTELEALYAPSNLKFIISSDQSDFTLSSANAVVFDLFLAVLIVSVVMLLFLHSFRSSMFVLVALPASLIPTFIFMYLFGFSLNLMTLMAMSLVVGILVDDSIVILENIYRHMEMGKDKLNATLEGRAEIGFTAISITLVDVVVFVPLALAGGMIGNILREFSLVVVCSTLMSLFVCFTITPLLASRFGRLEHLSNNNLWGRINNGFEDLVTRLRDAYTRLLAKALRKKRYILGGTLILLVASFALVPAGFIGTSFITAADRGEIVVQLELAAQTSLQETNKVVQQAEKILLARPDVKTVVSNIGFSGTDFVGSANSNEAEFSVTLVPKKERSQTDQVIGLEIREELMTIPGVKVVVKPLSITGNTQAEIMVAVKSGDRDSLRKAAQIVKEIVENTDGTQYVQFSTKNPKPEISVQLDRDKMSEYGINASEVGLAIATTFRGNDNTKYKYAGNEYDIMIEADAADKANIENIKKLSFYGNNQSQFTLDQFATVEEVLGESKLERRDRLPAITIESSAIGVPPGTIGQNIAEKIKEVGLPQGVTWNFEGNLKMQSDSFGSLGLALILAVVLVYLIMVALYESTIYPLVVLTALPLATVGALLALALTLEDLSIFSIIGMIMLMGLVAKNGILIVDFTNHRKAEGVGVVDALLEAGRERFRPILMTTIAMIVGMLPIALASGDGAEVKNGMAWVIIGGLSSSLILTLFVVPSIYLIVENMIKFFSTFAKRKEKNKTSL